MPITRGQEESVHTDFTKWFTDRGTGMEEADLQKPGCSCPRLSLAKTIALITLSALCLVAAYTQTRDVTGSVSDVPVLPTNKNTTTTHEASFPTPHVIQWGMKDNHPGRLISDILNLKVPDYIKDYKNPCWVDLQLDRVRCLPYFFIAGMPKSGTTDLWYSLGKHPQVRILQGKEPHWWTRRQYTEKGTVEHYVKHFDKSAMAIAKSVVERDGQAYHPSITGDASASTLWDNYEWKLIPENQNATEEPHILHAHLIRHLMPNAKIIVILRNPIDRLYSGYLYFTQWANKSQQGFHSACLKAISAMAACTNAHTIRHCIYNRIPNITIQTSVRLHISLYAVYIQDWFNIYPHRQMHFIRMENYSRDRAKVLNGVYDFLELDPLEKATLINDMPVENRRPPRYRNIGKMFNKTRTLLIDFYQPYNQELRFLLRNDQFDFTNFDD